MTEKTKVNSSPKDKDVPEPAVFFPSSLLMRKALFDHLTARGIQVSLGTGAFRNSSAHSFDTSHSAGFFTLSSDFDAATVMRTVCSFLQLIVS